MRVYRIIHCGKQTKPVADIDEAKSYILKWLQEEGNEKAFCSRTLNMKYGLEVFSDGSWKKYLNELGLSIVEIICLESEIPIRK